MSDEMGKIINALNRIEAGEGFVRQGETPDTAAPDFVRPEAPPDLCKKALQLLSRHLRAEIVKLVENEPSFRAVFVDDLSGS